MPCPSWLTASNALDATIGVILVATVLTAAEILALRSEFREGGTFDARVLRSTRPAILRRRLPAFSMQHVAAVQIALALLAGGLLAAGVSPASPFVALVLCTSQWPYLLPYGVDGSDVMAKILTIAVAVALVFEDHRNVKRVALIFIAAQLCLAYGASGLAKLFGRPWRAGTAVQGILHTAFGHPGVLRTALDRWSLLGIALSWSVIGVELAFPLLVALGGWPAVAGLLAVGGLQVGIAMAMGLNRFTPWFFAAFPATWWAACEYGLFGR